MESNSQTNIPSPDINNVRKCFETISNKNQPNKQILNEAQKYIESCKGEIQFLAILLELFDNQNENFGVRLLAIVEFKNLIGENWGSRRKTAIVYTDQMRKEIRQLVLGFLDKYQDKALRKQVNDILKIISFTDFPPNFPELAQYFIDGVQALQGVLKDEQMLLGDATFNFVKTLEIVMNERCKKRIGDYRALFNDVFMKLLEGFHEFWDYFHINMKAASGAVNKQNYEQIAKYFKLSRKADSIHIGFLCNGSDEMINNEVVIKLTNHFVQRCAELTELTVSLKDNSNIVEEISKNLYKYLYSLYKLNERFPLIFKGILTNYVKLIEFILDNPDNFRNKYILNAAAICLITALKRYSYHGEEIALSKKQAQVENYEETKKQCILDFHQYFTMEKIENFFNIFLVKLLPKRPLLKNNQSSDDSELDYFVEIENDEFTSEFEKLETPLYNLILKCTSELLIRFAEQSIPLVHGLATKVIQNELASLPTIVLDGVFAMIGELPRVYQQTKVDPSNFLDLGAILKYLEERAGSDLNLSKRIPVLIHKWIGLFSPEVKVQVIQNIVQMIQNLKHYVVQYECCMCLKVIFKSEQTIDLNYAALSEYLVPVIIDLLGRFKNPQVIWSLLEVLKLLFTKAQFSAQNDNIIAQLQNKNIQILTRANDEIFLQALVDMFKSVIASFQYGVGLTSVFVICIDYIDYHFSSNNFQTPLISLWLFLVREYNENQNVADPLKTLFTRYSEPLLNMRKLDVQSKFINVIEEYILAELIPADNYLNIIKIMENKLNRLLSLNVASEGVYNLKSALLSLMSTLVLIFSRQNDLENLKAFDKLQLLLLKELSNTFFDPEIKSFKASKISMLTLIDRFIIMNVEGFLMMLNRNLILYYVIPTILENQINFGDFCKYWAETMNLLHSPHTKRINAIAIVRLLPYIKNKELLTGYLEGFLRCVIPEVVNSSKGPDTSNQRPFTPQERCMDLRDSERKRVIRQTGLYYDIDLKDLFVKSFRGLIEENSVSMDELTYSIKDQEVGNWFIQILSN